MLAHSLIPNAVLLKEVPIITNDAAFRISGIFLMASNTSQIVKQKEKQQNTILKILTDFLSRMNINSSTDIHFFPSLSPIFSHSIFSHCCASTGGAVFWCSEMNFLSGCSPLHFYSLRCDRWCWRCYLF